MTRKDYVKFAAMLKEERVPDNGPIGYAKLRMLDQIADKTADIFEADNPNFDRARFLTACGVES
jgi:hypothetical protein